MLNNIYYVIMLSLFLTFSIGAMNYSNVHRTFVLMHRGIIESSLVTLDRHGNPVAYLDEELLEQNVRDYLHDNLDKYVSSYTVSYYYFYDEDGLVCVDHNCDSVKISLKAEINYFFHYEKAISFKVQEGKLHNE